MSTAYPEMSTYYGFLVGMAYTLPNSIAGLYAGSVTKEGNRKNMLIGVVLLLGACQMTSGIVDSFLVLVAMRFIHGTISSAVNPLAYSLIADKFPPNKRNTANSIVAAANFAGIAMSSMSILLIKSFGWRLTYIAMGGSGLLASLIGALILREPKRGAFVEEESCSGEAPAKPKKGPKPKGFKGMMECLNQVSDNPVCKNTFIAVFLRAFGNVILTAFVPVYFQKVFPAFKSEFALINACALVVLGFTSSILGGVLCDKLSDKTHLA